MTNPSPRPALFYTIKKEGYGTDFAVMRVTTKAPRQVYGSVEGMPTHCAYRDVFGNFPTAEEAGVYLDRIKTTFKEHAPAIIGAQTELTRAYAMRDDAVKRILQEAENASK